MSEDDPKPGVVIDVQADSDADTAVKSEGQATPKDEPAKTPSEEPPRKTNLLPLILAVVALIGVLVFATFSNNKWKALEQTLQQEIGTIGVRIDETRTQQQTLESSLDEASSALKSQADALQEQRDVLAQQRLAVDEAKQAFIEQEQKLADENLRLQEREAELRAAVADVHRRVGRSGTQWIIAEVEYLLRVANHRLLLARDVDTARAALEIADQRLRDTKDPGWAGVRAQIAREIAALSAYQPPDDAGLAARLSAMIEQIPSLKIDRAT
ncbi:MAG: uroporphyrinogen-III C-methyltransferase, partial [Halieaceae bacterium]|nr:uroporphyrinogen-III C-methyltransferase [Halieaceae bacterium]